MAGSQTFRFCPSAECPFLLRHGRAAEYQASAVVCSDCGTTLSDTDLATPETPAREPTANPGRGPRLRALLTVLGAVGVWALLRIALPFEPNLHGYTDDHIFAPHPFGLLMLGIAPWFTGFGLVELVAVCVPRLREIRIQGPNRRARLNAAGTAVGAVLALLQAWFLSRYGFLSGVDSVQLILLLFGGALIAMLTARALSRWTLSNGFSIFLAVAAVSALAMPIGVAFAHPDGMNGPRLVVLLIAFGGPIALARIASAPTSAPKRLQPWLNNDMVWPTSGLDTMAPAVVLVSSIAWIADLTGWGTDSAFIGQLLGWVSTTGPPYIISIGLGAVLLSTLYTRPSRISHAWRQLSHTPTDTARHVATRSTIVAVVTVVALAGLETLSDGYLPVGIPTFSVIMLVMVWLDIDSEWRFRQQHGGLVDVWHLHRLYAAIPCRKLLEREGIDAHLRALNVRAVMPFFGSIIPVRVMVPADSSERARQLLEQRLSDSKQVEADVFD